MSFCTNLLHTSSCSCSSSFSCSFSRSFSSSFSRSFSSSFSCSFPSSFSCSFSSSFSRSFSSSFSCSFPFFSLSFPLFFRFSFPFYCSLSFPLFFPLYIPPSFPYLRSILTNQINIVYCTSHCLPSSCPCLITLYLVLASSLFILTLPHLSCSVCNRTHFFIYYMSLSSRSTGQSDSVLMIF